MTRKKPRFGALPTLNMPSRSHESSKPAARPYRSVVQDETTTASKSCYKSFAEFCCRASVVKTLSSWECRTLTGKFVMKKMSEPFLIPEKEIIVDDGLGFTVKVFGCFLPQDHPIYLHYKRSMTNVTISVLVKELETYKMCCGVKTTELSGKLFHHVIPADQEDEDERQFAHNGYWRTTGCWLLSSENETVSCMYRSHDICE